MFKAQGAELDEPSYPYPVNYVELQGGEEDEDISLLYPFILWKHSLSLRGNLLGEDELSGNVFAVNSDGFFGPVCDDGWDNLAAMVVCR